ncbi:hypothetical protein LguiA_004651 [Lonicera macranthoides]
MQFMQRASLREEKTKEEHVTPDENFPSSSTPRKCGYEVEQLTKKLKEAKYSHVLDYMAVE